MSETADASGVYRPTSDARGFACKVKLKPETLGKIAMDAYAKIPLGTPYGEIRRVVGQAILDAVEAI